MGIFKGKNPASDSGHGGKHSKPKAGKPDKPMTKEERLAADVELIDNAYRKAELKKKVEPKSKSPMLDAYEKKNFGTGNGKHRKQ